MGIARIGTEFIVNTTISARNNDPMIAALADGRFVVVWQSLDGGLGGDPSIRARLFNADGTAGNEDGSADGRDFIVNSTTAGNQLRPAIAALADGRFVAAWTSDDPGDGSGLCIRARLRNADGSAAGNDFIVNTTTTNDQTVPMVAALSNGRFIVGWQSDSGDGSGTCVRARLYNADGTAVGTDFLVNTTTANSQADPTIGVLADGRFVVTWTSYDAGDGTENCIRARLYSANGSATGNDFIVNSTKAGSQFDPMIAGLTDGRFAMVWQSADAGDGSGTCVRGRLYNANGIAVGNDFIINTTTTNNQSAPTIAALADDRFVVIWSSDDPGDGSQSCIRARLYNVDGSASGNDFIVNSAGLQGQFSPTIAALADGRFVVSWLSIVPEGGFNTAVLSQIFDPTIFIGRLASETWQGGNFADRISGYGGNDTLSGLAGNDVINGDIGNDNLNGGSGNDRLFGGSGNDAIDGGTGTDAMAGGTGDDTYRVSNAQDKVIEVVGQGNDTVIATASYVLAAGTSVQILRTTSSLSTYNVNLTGNSLINNLQGNAGINILNGGSGSDTLKGFGAGDIFRFNTALGASNVDTIIDFIVPADTIQLENAIFAGLAAGTLAAAAFHIGAAAADASDRIIYNSATGGLVFDSNGNAAGGATQFAKLAAGLALTNADFFVV